LEPHLLITTSTTSRQRPAAAEPKKQPPAQTPLEYLCKQTQNPQQINKKQNRLFSWFTALNKPEINMRLPKLLKTTPILRQP